MQKFTAYERDNESDLDFAQARYFNSGVGRFISPDPFHASANASRPQSWNRYLYVENNPTNFTDPSGLSTCFSAECSGDDNERFMSAGEVRYESILNNGYDPAFNRFTGTVTVNYSTGIAGSGLVGGSIVLEQPTLDEVFDAYSGVAGRIASEQKSEFDEARRAKADQAQGLSGIDGFITNVTATKTEGYNFQQKDSNSLSDYLTSNKSFKSGSLFGSHAGCNQKGATCIEFRSKKGAFGIDGSLQVVLNGKGNGYFDVDRFNPYQFPKGTFGHLFLELLSPKVPGVSQVGFNGSNESDLIGRLSKVRAAYNQRR